MSSPLSHFEYGFSRACVECRSPRRFQWSFGRGSWRIFAGCIPNVHISMADPWLAHEVLRELDDANARYFALGLLSPSSRHYLVRIAATYMVSCLPASSLPASSLVHLVLTNAASMWVVGTSLGTISQMGWHIAGDPCELQRRDRMALP